MSKPFSAWPVKFLLVLFLLMRLVDNMYIYFSSRYLLLRYIFFSLLDCSFCYYLIVAIVYF